MEAGSQVESAGTPAVTDAPQQQQTEHDTTTTTSSSTTTPTDPNPTSNTTNTSTSSSSSATRAAEANNTSTSSPRGGAGSGLPLGGSRRASSYNNGGKGAGGASSAAGSEAGLPPMHRQSSNLANKIAAFSSGVAPLRKGIPNVDEDAITVEEVLHKLETAGRISGQDKYDLPVPLIRSAHQHLVTAREEASRNAKELAELKASRVQHIPPSTWIKREQKYKQDQEKHEHQVGQLRARIEALERELGVLREGSNVQPLEEKIKELEHQLVAAAEEKTKVQSKFHELSIKHRQLIETSPQVATIWNEVLVQQAADGHNAAAMQRLHNFDLRHTAASPSAGMPVVSAQPLPGVSAAAAVYGNGGPVPVPPAPQYSSSSSKGGEPSGITTQQSGGPSTPMQQPPSDAQQQQQQQPQTAEERAHALMQAVALEGLSTEASLAALQQLNYDLTMQLGCYQQMVSRLKDAMEQSDLEKAELEAEKMALEMQLHAAGGGGGGGGGEHGGGGSSSSRSASQRGGWGFWRRSVGMSAGGPGPAGMDDLDETGSMADGLSLVGPGSISSSRRSSMDLDGVGAGLGGSGGSNTGTPTKAAADAASADGGGGGGGSEDGAGGQQQQDQHKAASAAANSSSSTGGAGGLFAARRQRAAARAAAAAEALAKEAKELKRQLKSLQDENKYLVNNLVEIKMELAETQGANDQAKRALVRAMDKESCLDMQVSELRHMLDMATTLAQQYEQQANSTSMAQAGAAAAAAAGVMMAAGRAAVAAVSSSTPNSAKAAMAAMASPFGRPEPDAAGDVAADGAAAAGGTTDSADAGGGQQQQQQEQQQASSSADGGGAGVDTAAGAASSSKDPFSPPVVSFQLTEDDASFDDADEEGGAAGDAADEDAAAEPDSSSPDVPAAAAAVGTSDEGAAEQPSSTAETAAS